MKDRKLAWGVLLGGTILSSPAFAQSVTFAPSPEHWAMDARKVDRITGQTTWLVNELQIGPSGAGGLAVIGLHNSSQLVGTGAGTNWENMAITGGGSTVIVGTGTATVTFTKSGSTFTPVQANGATLTLSGSTYTFVDAAGTKIVFSTSGQSPYGNVLALAYTITFPTGEVDTLNRITTSYCPGGTPQSVTDPGSATDDPGAAGEGSGSNPRSSTTQTTTQPNAGTPSCQTLERLQSVSSSQGYQLHYNYVNNSSSLTTSGDVTRWRRVISISSVNLASSFCDPSDTSCATTVATTAYNNSTSADGNTQYQTVTDPVGRKTVYGYASGQFSVQTPISSMSDIVYTLATDGSNSVTAVQWRAVRYTYSRAVSGSLTTIDSYDPSGDREETVADTSISRIKSYTNGVNQTWNYTYTNGDLASVQTPLNAYIKYTRDGNGNVTQTSYWAANASSESFHTSAIYPGCSSGVTCNLPTSTTDANNNTTSYTYNQTYGSVLTVTGPSVNLGQAQTRYSYQTLQDNYYKTSGSKTASGVPVYRLTGVSTCRSSTSSCVGGSDETRTTIGYDANNNLLPISVKVAAGDNSVSATTTTAYNAAGDATSVVGPLGAAYTSVYRYDAAHQLAGVVGPDSDGAGGKWNPAARFTYNGDGNATLVEQGTVPSQADSDWASFSSHRQVATTYDSAGRKIGDQLQAGGTTYSYVQYSYDGNGRLDCTAQRMNPNVFTSSPDACTLGTVGAYGNDRIGRVEYDAANEVTKVWTAYRSPRATATQYSYYADGSAKTLTDQAGNVTTYTYDGLARLYQVQYPDGGSDYEQYGYDNNGNVTSHRIRGTSGASVSYGYDAMNRLTSRTPSVSAAYNANTSYAYDLQGHALTASMAYPSHTIGLTYGYDALGRTLSEASVFDGTSRAMTMAYDAGGRRTRLTWWDGFYVTYGYDNDSQLTSITDNAGVTLAGYGYDDDGRRTSRSYANGTSTGYGYDPVSRLTSLSLAATTGSAIINSATTVTLSGYNPAGQIGSRLNTNDAYAWTAGANVTRPYTNDNLNRYQTIAGAAQSYDQKSNLTSGGSTTLAYNIDNQVQTGGGGGYYFDAAGRMTIGTGAGVWFAHAGGAMVAELNLSGDIARRYVPGPGVDETAVWYDNSGTGAGGGKTYYLDQDERGSVIRITSGTHALTGINSYDEYGIPGTTNIGRFQYTGQAWLPEVGLYDFKARLYSPQLGRFLQPDPIGYGDGNNIYNYAHADPVNNIDPSGTAVCAPGAAGEITVCGLRRSESGPGANSPGAGATITIGGGSGANGGGSGGGGGAAPQTGPEIVVTGKKIARVAAIVVPIVLVVVAPEIDVPVLAAEEGEGVFAAIGRFFSRFFGRSACFAAGTLVQTDHGLRPIETIKPGDMVLSRDEKTGRTAYKRVTAVKRPTQDDLYAVELDVPAEKAAEHHAEFQATATHPWRTTEGRWVPTAQLQGGMTLVRADGAPARVEAVRDTNHKALTYNLTVDGYHTYFVGKDKVWVHNACLQSGGNKINPDTARALGFETRRDAGRALEALKEDNGLPPNFHGNIMSNGDYINPETGDVIGNIHDYVS